jgi:hypothetical protein
MKQLITTTYLDHPKALPNYQARGFRVFRREEEVVELPDDTKGPHLVRPRAPSRRRLPARLQMDAQRRPEITPSATSIGAPHTSSSPACPGCGCSIAGSTRGPASARSLNRLNVVKSKGLLALGADDFGVGLGPASAMSQNDRGTLLSGEPCVAPSNDRGDDGEELPSLLGQNVLVAGRSILVLDALHHFLVAESAETLAENVAADSQVALDLFESADAVAGLPQHQRRPPVTEKIHGPSDRAGPAGKRCSFHGFTLSVARMNVVGHHSVSPVN